MSKREVIAYAITHAPRGQKGGPYEASCEHMHVRYTTRDLADARKNLALVRKASPTARVIRIVRQERPSEASAVEVLRELVATWDRLTSATPMSRFRDAFALTHAASGTAEEAFGESFVRARAVLAASGPDPMPVVRAAMTEERARVRMARAEHGIGDFAALETAWLRRVEETRVAVKAYRKAGGK